MITFETKYFSTQSSFGIKLIGPEITTGPWIYFYSTDVRKQSCCYEFQWLGGSDRFVVGFKNHNDRFIYYFPYSHKESPYVSIMNENKDLSFEEILIDLNITENIPALICYNFPEKKFTIIQNNNSFSHQFQTEFDPQSIQVLTFSGASNNPVGYLSFNFDEKTFHNKIPPGHKGWNNQICKTINKYNISFHLHILFLIFIFK